MKLIDDWPRIALKLNSIQWSLVWSAVVTTWLLTPEVDRQALLSLIPFGVGPKVPAYAVLLGFVGGVYARLRAQPGVQSATKPPDPDGAN